MGSTSKGFDERTRRPVEETLHVTVTRFGWPAFA
jgi:hypothetical protein